MSAAAIDANKALVRAFFAALSAGEVPDDLLAPDMTAWTTTGGLSERARWQGGIRMLGGLFDGGLAYTIDTLTAEEDRVAVEARSAGTLKGGGAFANTYMFLIRLRDGRIVHVAEHMNPKPVDELIRPAMIAAMAAKPMG